MSGTIPSYLLPMQRVLFPDLEETLLEHTGQHYKVIRAIELCQLEEHIEELPSCLSVGRPRESRRKICRAFIAKAALNLATTRQLLDRLRVDQILRRICGWERVGEIPSEASFSRAFEEFSETELPTKLHEALVKGVLEDAIVLNISRDSTAIEGREKPATKRVEPPSQPKKRGRRRKNDPAPVKELSRIEFQLTATLDEMKENLPKQCDIGCKRNSKGFSESWTGFKLHLDVADGDIPISAIVTSASLHDSQAAIPLATMTEQRTTALYELMDAAYDSELLRSFATLRGRIAIIDKNTRTNTELKKQMAEEQKALKRLNMTTPEKERFKNRSSAERVNSQIKDNFGGRFVRVRGYKKVTAHLMFGVLTLTVQAICSAFA
jgi:hypothetical protein